MKIPFIKTSFNKKTGIIISVIVVLLIAGVTLFITLDQENSVGIIGGADGPTSIILTKDTLDDAVSAVLIADNYRYMSGECSAEGHIILGSEVNGETTTVYALTMVGEYGFQDDNFVKVSGSGTIPAVIKLDKTENGYTLNEIIYPRDGSDYIKSIKEMFPTKYHNRVLSIKKEDSEKLKKMEESYAHKYLEQLGRNAQVGDYGDFEHTLLTGVGVSVEVSNKLAEKAYANYPFWIGKEEKVEDGIRYVYEMAYNKENNQIVLSKSNYETKEVVEKIIINSLTGNVVAHNEDLKLEIKNMGYIYEFDANVNSFKYDPVEWITHENTERIAELKIDANLDMPNGYYIYNPDQTAETLNVDENTTYSIIDWKNTFSEERNYTTNKAEEFTQYLGTYKGYTPPFIIEYQENGNIKSIVEQYVP